MTANRVILAAIWVVILLVSRSLWIPADARAISPRLDVPTTAVSNPDALPLAPAGVKPRTDLYGNQIDSAVGDYRIDIRGYIYEHHDPDTAVTALAPPGV